MHAILASVALFGAALAAPTSYIKARTPAVNSLPDGFPKFSTAQLATVENTAHGTLPNGGAPPNGTITALGLTSIEFINNNENFEVFFFDSLINNITNYVPGYEIPNQKERDFILSALKAHKAQEELHATLATKLLASQGKGPILPCQYQFGATNFKEAIKTAALFTDVTLGTLQDVQANFAAGNGEKALIPGVASVIGQEGEQDGFYRLLESDYLIPAALPFLTRSTIEFAFSALNQNFIVPGSCPNQTDINLPIFGTLVVNTQNIIPEKDQTLTFSVDIKTLSGLSTPAGGPTMSNYASYNYESLLSLQYINQQDVPVEAKVSNVRFQGTVVTFDADFPASASTLNSLTIAAVVVGHNFTTADAVAKATLFGPGLIDIN